MLKYKLVNSFGSFGYVLFFLICSLISIMPFVFINISSFGAFLLIALQSILPITSIIFWLWGLFCAIGGPQDIFAIIYYIAFVVLFLPFFINTLVSVLSVFKKKY